MRILFLFAACTPILASAQLFLPLRDALTSPDDAAVPGVIQQICLNAVDYSLASLETVSEPASLQVRHQDVVQAYHARMNCLMDDVLQQAVVTSSQRAQEHLRALIGRDTITGLDAEKIICEMRAGVYAGGACSQPQNEACTDVTIGALHAAQTSVRDRLPEPSELQFVPPATQCNAEGEYALSATNTAACRVSESLTAEFCGFALWLRTSALDEIGLLEQLQYEQKNGTKDVLSRSSFAVEYQALQERNVFEEQVARQTLIESLRYYQGFQSALRLHVAVLTTQEMIRQTLPALQAFEWQISTFPSQFDFQTSLTSN